ncbi:MAG: IPT/TIG domain-containing protein, partial [bacterium]|nr:IPT/TIG domain-containing protein [bacterium]
IRPRFNTIGVQQPKLAFDLAYAFEPPVFATINDYLVVEISVDGGPFQRLDVDGVDPFDGFYSTEPRLTALTPSDYVYYVLDLPQAADLRIAFRFESDFSGFDQGAFLDNVQVYDASAADSTPRIRTVTNLAEDAFYADLMGETLISGNHLLPAQTVTVSTAQGNIEVPFTALEDNLRVTLPPVAGITATATGAITVTRDNGKVSEPFAFSIQPAPKPRITAINPSPFYLGGTGTRIEIYGEHFRPSQGSRVMVDFGQELVTLTSGYIEEATTKIVIDIPRLKQEPAGAIDFVIKNQVSQLESTAYPLALVSGDGSIVVDDFLIELGGGVGTYDPRLDFYKTYPLQRDQAFTLIWQGTGFTSRSSVNIRVGGKDLVINGKEVALGQAGERKLAFTFEDFFGMQDMLLEIAPMVLDITGEVTAEIRLGNGVPVITTFHLEDPQPPAIYLRDGDFRRIDVDATTSEEIFIFGNNFRGVGTGATDMESITRVYLFPAGMEQLPEDFDPRRLDQSHPDFKLLPAMTRLDINLQPDPEGFQDNDTSMDDLRQVILANTVPVPDPFNSYRILVINPDSGLYTVSTMLDFVTFAKRQ